LAAYKPAWREQIMKGIRFSIMAGAAGLALLLFAGIEAHAGSAPLTPTAVVAVHPAAVSLAGDGPGGCVGINPKWVCTFHVSETSGSTESLTWRASTTVTSAGGSEVTYSPSSGVLHPGNSVTVKATVGCDGGVAFLITTTANGTYGNGAAVYYMQCG
jgi:hypothetical protein